MWEPLGSLYDAAPSDHKHAYTPQGSNASSAVTVIVEANTLNRVSSLDNNAYGVVLDGQGS
jgi:hypothetical protein